MENLMLPVFPLPEVVFFPRVILPLHIFEPRYRQLVDDMLSLPEDQRLIVIANLEQDANLIGDHPFTKIGTVGKMVHHEPLEDGRSNIVLYGQFTVEMEEIVPSDEPYRIARITDIRQEFWENPGNNHEQERLRIIKAVSEFAQRSNVNIENIEDINLDDLINGLSFSLNLTGEEKQTLLEEPNLNQRLNILIGILDNIGFYRNYIPEESEFQNIN
jgi:Lon protease-like protein